MKIQKFFCSAGKTGILFVLFIFCHTVLNGAVKTSNGSGLWQTAANWNPLGVPTGNDQVIIRAGDSLCINNNCATGSLTLNAGGIVGMAASKILTITGNLIINGRMTMNGGDINFTVSGASFTLGASGSFVWEPKTNTVAGASLFTNGIENFDPASSITIKKWYNYNVPLATVVSGNFGNLTLNSLNGSYLTEWNQDNQFQTHQVLGNLCIDQGWVVLDKSGNISNTTIGSIELKNANSYLDLHGGTHPGSFTVTTNSISIQAGMLNGIFDGNGNISLQVNGNVTLSSNGYFFLIYNDGVPQVGNGNCNMVVQGNYTQTSGDFRAIYNLTTTAAGTSSLNLNHVFLSGGIFMGHYACHVGNATNTLLITGNLNINFNNANDKFRAVGLSQLGSTINNAKLNFTVGGTMTISGPLNSEVVSHVASGSEVVTINGIANFNGCTTSFDYGVPAAAHPFSLTFNDKVTVNDGKIYLSRIGGNGTAILYDDIQISGGTLIAKGDVGAITVTVNGNYTQSGGSYFLHSNVITSTNDVIQTVLNGSFTHSGGTISFDDNASNTAATHIITMNGPAFNLTGAGTITHASPGTGTVFGLINFNRTGVITYNGHLNHTIQQVKQAVQNRCILDINNTNIQVASHMLAGTDYFKIASGGCLQMNSNQIYSNAFAANSGMRVESGALMKIKRPEGLYDGTSGGTIHSAGNMNFYLDINSTIEYMGNENQVITGTGVGLATTNNHKYGNLKINFAGTPDKEFVYPVASNVFIRKNLNLAAGEFKLNSYTVTIEAGGSSAITRNSGYIKSETNGTVNNSIVKWMNLTSGVHTFPFGVSQSEYIPILVNPQSGMGGYATVSTTAKLKINNPRAHNTKTKDEVILRWYNLSAPGITADIVLSYKNLQNATSLSPETGSTSIQKWNGTDYTDVIGYTNNGAYPIGTISLSDESAFLPWVAVYSRKTIPIAFRTFDARQTGENVSISWNSSAEPNNDIYKIEKSNDGKYFSELPFKSTAPIASTTEGESDAEDFQYLITDYSPYPGTSYYRLKKLNDDGTKEYSKLVTLKLQLKPENIIQSQDLFTISPNPFKDSFTIRYACKTDEPVTIQLFNTGGQEVFQSKTQSVQGINKFEYSDGNKLTPGTYVLNVTCRDKKMSKKIIKNM